MEETQKTNYYLTGKREGKMEKSSKSRKLTPP